MRGFMDAIPVLEANAEGFGWDWAIDLPGGLCAVAIRYPLETEAKWIDLRGDKTAAE